MKDARHATMSLIESIVSHRRRNLLVSPLEAALACVLALLAVPQTAPAREIVHEVVSGHTLGAIARRYGTSVEAIEKRNRLQPGQHIHPGQKLSIFVEEPPAKQASRKGRPDEPSGRRRQGPAKHKLTFTEAVAAARAACSNDDEDRSGCAEPATRRARHAASSRRTAGTGQPSLADRYARKPPRPGHVTLMRFSERFSGQLVDSRGRLVPDSHLRVSRLLRDLRTRQVVPINRRLLHLITDLSDHFGGRPIVVVSGFRMYTGRQHTADSKHNYGRAVDFRVVGVPNEAVRDFCLRFPNVGVGYYPNSTFVHVDTREHKATWVDVSRPGKAPRYVKPRRAGASPRRRKAAARTPATSSPRAPRDGTARSVPSPRAKARAPRSKNPRTQPSHPRGRRAKSRSASR